MTNLQLFETRMNVVLYGENLPEASNVTLENLTEVDGEGRAILRYQHNSDDRDSVLGVIALYKAGLRVDFDGDSSTVEFGVDLDTDPPTTVVMVRLPLWRENG